MNREVFPGGIYPLTGDVVSTAGNQPVTVVGIQNIPVTVGSPTSNEIFAFVSGVGLTLVPTMNCIAIEGYPISDDNIISVNVAKLPLVNGS